MKRVKINNVKVFIFEKDLNICVNIYLAWLTKTVNMANSLSRF